MGYIEDIAAEIRAVESWANRNQRADAAASGISEAQAQNMALAARMYPDMSPGALLALGHGGYRPDHPLVRQLAELSTRERMRNHPYGAEYGQYSITPGMEAEVARKRNAAASMRRQQEWEARQSGMNPQQRRLVEAGGVSSPRRRGLMEAAKSRGIITPDGAIVRPTAPKYEDGEFRYESLYHEDTDKLFQAVMAALAEQQGNDDPIPFTWGRGTRENGEAGVFHPKTGNSEVVRVNDGVPQVDVPGPADEWLSRANQNITTWLSNTRVPSLPGTEDMPLVGQQASSAGYTTPKDVLREGLFQPLDAPLQETQGQIRNLYALAHGEMPDFWQTQSDFGIRLTTGIDDSGTGFFTDPESEVAAERRRRESERGQIGGHNVTLGRWLVDGLTPFDPDTRPAMVLSGITDTAVAIAGDPSSIVLGGVGKAGQVRRLFAAADATEEAAGVIKGLRWMAQPVQANKFLDSAAGQEALSFYANSGSAWDIWRSSRRKFPIRLAGRLANEAHTPEEARAILEPMLGTRVREVAAVDSDIPSRLQRPSQMPIRGRIDAHDNDVVAREAEAFLHNAHASDEQIARIVDRIATADDPVALNRAIREAHSEADGLLEVAGVADADLRSTLTRMHADAHEEASVTFAEAVAHQGATNNPFMLAGEEVYYPGAHLVTELAPRWLSFADARPIRRLTSDMPRLMTGAFTNPKGQLRFGVSALEGLQNEIWKPFQLMRAAWTVRVIAEEQVRMAAAGYDSMFKNPLSFIAWRLGRTGKTDIAGDLFDEADQFKAAMSQAHGGWVDRAVVPTGVKTRYNVGDVNNRPKYNQAWASELIRLHGDPVARQVANAATLDEAIDWFTRGAGNKWRGQLADAHPGRFDDVDQARAYIETVQRRIDYATSGNDELLDAIRTGKIGGKDLMSGTTQNPDLVGRLDQLHDGFGPQRVIGDETRTVTDPNRGERWRSGVDRLFGMLMTNRTNNLSRSPVFRQEYYREVQRIFGAANAEAQARILSGAESANLSSRALNRLRSRKAVGDLSFDEIDFLAKGRALDETKELLYDLTRRGRFMDAARLVFPFGEAWSEVLTRWFGREGLIRSNPKTVRRFQQTVQAARGEDFGEVMTGEPGGFFTVNEFGEEVFEYPGSRLLTDQLLGVPVPLTGNVQGLSMFGTITPGLGPVVQIPVAWLLEQKPGPQAVKKLFGLAETFEIPVVEQTVKESLVPFGSPSADDQGEIFNLANFLPAWMRTGLSALFEEDVASTQTYGNSVLSMAAYLRSTGNYGNSRADQQQLMEDAAEKARWFTVIKMLGQTTAPASPSPDWLLEANGEQVRARALAEEYNKLREDDFASADQVFYERYGSDVLAAVQSKSNAASYGIPTTREGAQWVLDNPGIEDQLPHTYGFFAPQGGDFDYALYQKQLREGDRQILDVETYTRLMNDTKGDLLYQRAVEMAGDDTSEEMTEWLRGVREKIHKLYPGWQDEAGLLGKPDTETMVRELYEAVENDAIANTDAGKGLALYLKGRDMAMEEAKARGYAGFSEAEGAEDLRVWLAESAGRIVDKYPEFKTVYDFVLSREVTGA